MNTQLAIIGLVILVLFGGGMYFYTMTTPDTMMDSTMDAQEEMQQGVNVEDTMMKEDAMMETGSEAMEKESSMMTRGGTYEAYAPEKIAWAKDVNVVLFFRADWCPVCRTVDADIRSKRSSIPKDVIILDVNYDTETALKQKYGVTYQHTFVQVDASGNAITKWSGGQSLADVLAKVQ